MATVYILYSSSIDQHYIGSCKDIETRLQEHLIKSYQIGFTHRIAGHYFTRLKIPDIMW